MSTAGTTREAEHRFSGRSGVDLPRSIFWLVAGMRDPFLEQAVFFGRELHLQKQRRPLVLERVYSGEQGLDVLAAPVAGHRRGLAVGELPALRPFRL